MAAVSDHRPSPLNPNAPMFVPWAYRAVEDFSDEWWELVQSSACFRDYWLQECFQEPQYDVLCNGGDIDLPEIEAAFGGYKPENGEEEEGKGETGSKDVVSLAALKWGKNRVMQEPPKYAEKAPKVVNVKVRPRMIQQPR